MRVEDLSFEGAVEERPNTDDVLRQCFGCGLIVVDDRGEIVSANSTAKRMLAGDPTSNSKSSSVSLPEPLQSLVRESMVSQQPIADRAVSMAGTNGAPPLLNVTAWPAIKDGRTVLVTMLLQDPSLATKLQNDLQRLDQLASAGMLASSMAHEIKNAMVAVKTFVDLLLEKNPNAELAALVQREMGRVDSLVSGMLRFAGPVSGQFSSVSLHDILDHSLRLVRHRVGGKVVSFQHQFEAGDDRMEADARQMEQAFINLLLNAVESIGTEGALTIRTQLVPEGDGAALREGGGPAERLRVEITDTGTGIAQSDLGRIFEPFFTTKKDGTGLGLAVTQRIIREHGGTIGVQSDPGSGTTFVILLPPRRVATRL